MPTRLTSQPLWMGRKMFHQHQRPLPDDHRDDQVDEVFPGTGTCEGIQLLDDETPTLDLLV